MQAHFALWGSDQQYGDPSPMSHKYYPGMCGGWASVSARAGMVRVVYTRGGPVAGLCSWWSVMTSR